MQSVPVSSHVVPSPARTSLTRQKLVSSNGEIPHLWAHQTRAEARNANGSLYFKSATIFSYGEHFPIASHVTNKRGQKAILFTTATYSVTTSGHCGRVRNAIPDGVPVFSVPYVFAPRGPKETVKAEHAKNQAHYVAEVEKHLLKSARARVNAEWDHKQAIELRDEAFAYAKFFGLRKPTIKPIPALSSDALAAIKKRDDERRAKAAAKTLKENKERIAQWLAGRTQGDLPIGSFSLPSGIPTLLRIVGDEVETSRGARFPIAHAKRGLALVRAVMSRGEEWRTNGHTCHLGHYSLDRITPDGTVYAGCHIVPFASIERIASALDVYVVPASQASAE